MLGGARLSIPPVRESDAFSANSLPADSSWSVVDVPHDFVLNQSVSEAADELHRWVPRKVSWYRKHFTIPAAWKGSGVWLHFEGVTHIAEVWVNGLFQLMHGPTNGGYPGFIVQLDNISSLRYAGADTNVVAVRVDASIGSESWYEGGGIYRPVHLVRLNPAHVVRNGLFVSPELAPGGDVKVSAEVEGAVGDGVVLIALLDQHKMVVASTSAPILSAGALHVVSAVPGSVCVSQYCTITCIPNATHVWGNCCDNRTRCLYDPVFQDNRCWPPSPNICMSAMLDADLPAETLRPLLVSAVFKAPLVQAWSIQQPVLYSVTAVIMQGATVVDELNVTVGFRKPHEVAPRGST